VPPAKLVGGLTATLVEKTQRQEERSASLVVERKVELVVDQGRNTLDVDQHPAACKGYKRRGSNLKKEEKIEEIEYNYIKANDATYDDGNPIDFILEFWDDVIVEAEYRGRKVKLNKPMRGDVKKFKVYVKDPKTKNVKKVNFGDPNMRIKKSNPKRRKSFRARHNCDNPGPKTKARYWSCRKW
jgi:hypothetical protein